jgi:hypothetical protein
VCKRCRTKALAGMTVAKNSRTKMRDRQAERNP